MSAPFNGRLVYNDEKHTYMLDGKRVKSASTVAKLVPDDFILGQWRKRQVAIGMVLDPNLIEKVAVDLDNSKAINAVAEEAMAAAGAHRKADRGTQMHRASQLVDMDGKLLTAQQRADAAAWLRTIDRYGIGIDPDFIEQFVVYPESGIVGRFDRLAYINDTLSILDLKSGENAVKYPQGTCVQLAIYRFAPYVSTAIDVTGDKSTVTEWRPMPTDIDEENGYVVFLAPGADVGELWRINIAHGRRGADIALEIVEWRKAHNYGKALATPVENSGPEQPAVEAATTPALPDEDRRAALRIRYSGLTDEGRATFDAAGVDTTDLDAIERALDDIHMGVIEEALDEERAQKPERVVREQETFGQAYERHYGTGLGPPDTHPTEEQLAEFANLYRSLSRDGRKAHNDTMARIGAIMGTLPAGSVPTLHRFNIGRTALNLRRYEEGTFDTFDDLLERVIGDIAPGGEPDPLVALCELDALLAEEAAVYAAFIAAGLDPAPVSSSTAT